MKHCRKGKIYTLATFLACTKTGKLGVRGICFRRAVLDTTLCDKFVRHLRLVGGFLHDIAEILLKVA
jgi:hypothetical protein